MPTTYNIPILGETNWCELVHTLHTNVCTGTGISGTFQTLDRNTFCVCALLHRNSPSLLYVYRDSVLSA